MGALRPPSGAEPQRRRRHRGEWRRLGRCGVCLSPGRGPRDCSPSARRGGCGARAEAGGGSEPRAAPPSAARSRRQEAAMGSPLRLSVLRPGAARLASPRFSPGWRKPPASARAALAPSGTSASLQVSGAGARGVGTRRGGPHPLPSPRSCAPEARPPSWQPCGPALSRSG